ncbi:MAG: radical SAM protein [Proteobacteria bacterium]|nr:radical SAM protein [Desulfobulbaceae bacterium]MBU4153535.1 radical SAM protein [Pseudomonadota bacterium]MDP2105564.1 radical SAM protein [Desulfobulbaceae bacterium]
MSKTNRIDSHKLQYHPARVAQWQERGDCFPVYVEIGLTNRCNHRCVFCALDWLERGGVDINSEVLVQSLADMAAHGVKSIMFAGEGESLLHRDAPLFIRVANAHGIKVAVTTNGVPLTPDKAEACLPYLSWIRFSVNAGTAEQYAAIHQTKAGDFERVLANIRYAAEFKRQNNLKVDIGVQILLLPEAFDGVLQLAELVKDAGADNFQVKPYSQHPSSSNRYYLDYQQYLHLEPQLKAFESETFTVFFRSNSMLRLADSADYGLCHGLPFFALINAHGQIIPCNLFYNDPEFIYGDLKQQSFAEIWTGEQRKKVLEAMKKRNIKECRQGCRLDAINRYLHRVVSPEERDDFI